MSPRSCIAVATVVAVTVAVAVAGDGVSHAIGAIAGPRADAARVISLREYANLYITKNNGSSLDAQGHVSGTLTGELSLHVVVNSAERLSAYLVGRSSSGTLSGRGSASFGVAGSGLYYKGTVSISHGTGRYSHASGGGIHIEGVMNRQRRSMTVNISGRMRL